MLVLTVVLCLRTAPAGEEPPAAPDASSDIKIFVKSADWEEFLKKLGHPDFILKRGATQNEGESPREPAPLMVPPAAVVDSVRVRGSAEKDLAKLVIEFGITSTVDSPAWVPIRLDENMLIEVREGERKLDVRDLKGKGWQVELRGKGQHTVRVDLLARLKASGDGYRLELAIPEAAQTQFQIDVPQRVVDASAGLEPIAFKEGRPTKLEGHLTARSRLDVSWRVEAEPGIQLPHLLAMQGEIAVDIDADSLRTRSWWMIHAVRGTTRNLEFHLDPNVEVLDVELDGQTPPAGSERVPGGTKLTINLVEPLRPGEPKKLTMTTRLALSAQASPRVAFTGFSLANAKDQSGALSIAPSGNVYVQGTPGRGVRQFDLRDLPEKLRVRPSSTLAYQFVDQPFELNLSVEPSPPLVRTESRTTVALSARSALIETWLDYKIARGRLYEAKVSLPRGLELDLTGPEDIVESSKLEPDAAEGAGTRVLTVLLKQRARDAGAFSLRLAGRQAIDPAKPVALALFRPLDSTAGGGRIVVVADRDLTVEGVEQGNGEKAAGTFRLATGEPPADWPWPADRAGSGADEPPTLWLRHDDHPAFLPLQITVHPRTITHESNLSVRVERRAIEVRQEIICTVRFGTMEQLNVSVPRELKGKWDIEEGNVASRQDLGTGATGESLARLNFAQPVSDRARLKLRYRLPLSPGLDPDQLKELDIPWVRVRGGTSGPVHAAVTADPGLELKPLVNSWKRDAEDEPSTNSEAGPDLRFRLDPSEHATAVPLRVAAAAYPLTVLPTLVVARHWLRTIQGPDQSLHVTASYWVETHQGSLPVLLPPGAEEFRAKVGGEVPGQVEASRTSGHRIRFPARWAAQPVLVEVDYSIPARFVGSSWVPPRVMDNALVGETLWEVTLPSSRVLVGVPSGWTDENEWYWSVYVWKRRPWKGTSALAAWVGGPSGRGSTPGLAGDEVQRDDRSYLFGRLGPPTDLRPWAVEGLWLLGICSGSVLGLGTLFVLFWTPPARFVGPVLLVAVLGFVIVCPPSVTVVLVQASLIGVALLLMMIGIHVLVERRRSASDLFGEPSGMSPGPGSSVSRQGGVGSDDSTAIRVRTPSTTMDYIVAIPPPSPERPSGQGSSARLD